MRRSAAVAAAVLAMQMAAGAARADFELPLHLREWQGAGGLKHVSNGVPLLPGQAMDTGELHVVGPDGKEVPAQFRVLARYWRADNSIRWVLVDFIGAVPDKDEAVYKLVGRKARTDVPQTGLKVVQDDEFIRVNTEAALFEISRKRFNLLNRVAVDGDLDGQFTEAEIIVHPDPLLGPVVTDPQGRKYYGSQGETQFRIIDAGPVRVTVLAKGVHVSKDEGAFQPHLYGFEIYMTFHVGMPYCNIDAILTNNFAEPVGEPHIRDWSVLTRVGKADAGGWGMDAFTSGYCSVGGGPGESALLYQDSPGTSHWKDLPGFEPRTKLATFRGYRMFRVSADGKARTEVDSGDFARGCAQTGRANLGAVIAPRHFWQQFPKAIQYFGDGTLRYGLFPAEYSTVHWLEDGSAKGHEFQLFFYLKGPNVKKQYTAMGGNFRPYAHVVLDNYLSQPMALPSPEHCGQAGALSDLGQYRIDGHLPKVDFPLERWERRYLMTDDLKGNGYGWQVFGNRWEEMAGHSPWNYEPKVTSASLFNYLTTRQPNWLERGLRISRQARDVRAYLIDDADLLDKWSKAGAYNRLSIMESFRRKVPELEAHPYRRSVWPLPNHEHLNLDEVYDLYLLTGDERARRCMEVVACHGAMSVGLAKGYPIGVTRSTGWCLRVLMRYYELTGDAKFKPYVETAMNRFWADVNKAGTDGAGTWFLGIYHRGVAGAYLATGDERMRDLAIGLADWARNYEATPHGYPYQGAKERWRLKPEDRGGPCPWANAYLLDTHGFAYQQIGDEAYLKALELAWEKLGYPGTDWLAFIPTAMEMAYGPRSDKTPPAAVADLKATAGKGEATLTWTAPGDDDKTGQAAVYQVKYAAKPILEFVPWPDRKDTHITFWGAENVADEPKPRPAGSAESFIVRGLAAGKYYFAIKTRDECSNQSGISNVVEADIP